MLVSVAEAKAFINLDHDEDDSLITSLIHAAEVFVETSLNRDLRARNYTAVFNASDIQGFVCFYATGRPAASVSAVKMWDSTGTLTTLDGDGEDAVYAVRAGKGGEKIVAIDRDALTLYSAGNDVGDYMLLDFATADATSASLVGYHAIKRAVLHLVTGGYEARESEVQGSAFNENPAVDRLLRPYRYKLNVRGV